MADRHISFPGRALITLTDGGYLYPLPHMAQGSSMSSRGASAFFVQDVLDTGIPHYFVSRAPTTNTYSWFANL